MSRLNARVIACPLIIILIAVCVPLLVRSAPWPIPARAYQRNDLRRAWSRTGDSKQICVAHVREIRGIANRMAVLDVIETIKGGPPRTITIPLGKIVGTDDVGNTLLVLDDYMAYLVRHADRPAEIIDRRLLNEYQCWVEAGRPQDFSSCGLDAPPCDPVFSGDEIVEAIKDFVQVQSAGEELSEDDLRTLDRYISGDRNHWSQIVANDFRFFLEKREAVPGVQELLQKLPKAR